MFPIKPNHESKLKIGLLGGCLWWFSCGYERIFVNGVVLYMLWPWTIDTTKFTSNCQTPKVILIQIVYCV